MALNARKVKTNSGPKAPLLDEGAYPARLVAVIDLGLQPQQYNGESKPPKDELQIIYELTDEFMPDADGNPDETKPRWMWESFPLNHLNSDKAKSTARYYALDPDEKHDGDWASLLSFPVVVAVTKTKSKDGNEYNNVGSTSTMRAKEAAKLPELVNDPILFDMSKPDLEVFLSLPERIQEKIKDSLSFGGSAIEKLLSEHKSGGKKTETTKGEKPAPDAKSGVDETASLGERSEVSPSDGEDDSEW